MSEVSLMFGFIFYRRSSARLPEEYFIEMQVKSFRLTAPGYKFVVPRFFSRTYTGLDDAA